MQRSQCEKENVQLVQELAEVDGPFESPINLNFTDLVKLELPSLTWNKPDAVPKKMKLTNTGHTVIISGKWKSERPYLTGGPLDGKYVFSQIHFHWGPDNCKGSEHQVCGESFPLEMHVAHFKSEYMTQESALREKDGMVVLVYLFKWMTYFHLWSTEIGGGQLYDYKEEVKINTSEAFAGTTLQEEPNNSLKKIISALPCIKQANSSQPLECRSILALCNPFTDDYFMYWGSVVTSSCAHILLWIVCREPFGISREQVEEFRKILDSSNQPIRRNNREPQPLHKRNVFHVNASRYLDEPMLPIKNILGCFCYPTDSTGREDKRSEGDGGCHCDPCGGRPQEELEGRKVAGCEQDIEVARGNGVFMQQTVYYQHSAVHSVPMLAMGFDDLTPERPQPTTTQNGGENETETKEPEFQEVSQSCCFLSVEEERSLSGEKRGRERHRERRRQPIDSVTTLANLIETLETLKTQTYRKLKEIEAINQEIRGMKSSCENLDDKQWLRHAEKIMSRQKRFTIRSSQCCFSELKKLAKECNFDKLLDDKIISEGGEEEERKSVLLATDSALVCSNASGDKMELSALEKVDSTSFSFHNSERFSRKSQKLIQSFFEDIKETEEAQLNLEKSLLLKKFENLSKRRSNLSNVSSLNIPHGHMYVTKNMMNLGRIREQFFTEVTNDEKAIAPATDTKMVPAGGKKKRRSFFNISLSGFENESSSAAKKGPKRPFFTKSALAWLNNRLNSIHDTSPVIPLRITDIELKTGRITTKKKSKQSVKSVRKVASEEHIRTEVSSYMSESIVSEFSDKQSRISRHSRTQTKSIIRGIEGNLETRKSEVSVLRIVKDLDANNFFVRLNTSGNGSSGSSLDSDKNDAKSVKRRSRRDIWENESSTVSGFRREVSNKYYSKAQDVECIRSVTGNVIERRISTSSDSSILIKKQSRREVVMVTSRRSSRSDMPRSRDVSVDATEDRFPESPRRKKLKLEWKCRSYDSQPQELHAISYIETECHKVRYVESECQADLNPLTRIRGSSREKTNPSTDVSTGNSLERLDVLTALSLPFPLHNEIESLTETDRGSTGGNTPRQLTRDTSTEAYLTLPPVAENSKKELEKKKRFSENEVSDEVSVTPRRSSDTLSEHSKDFAYEVKRTVVLSNHQESFWAPGEVRYGRAEASTNRDHVAEVQTNESIDLRETLPSEKLKLVETPRTEPEELTPSEKLFFSTSNHLFSDEKINIQTDSTQKDPEFKNLFTVEEIEKSVDVSRDVSQNDLSECNEYDLQTDSNGTMNYNRQKKRSRDTTPSIPSSDEEKQLDTSIATASSILRVSSHQKPFSTESFNSFKNMYEVKQRKRRQSMKKKSKHLVRKNTSMMRKLNKIGGSNLDFTNLTEEEQLKIISANVARFVKQKLVEHKQFFDFEKSETVKFDVENWSKSGQQEFEDDKPTAENSAAEEKVQVEQEVAKEQQPEETPPRSPRPSSPPTPSSPSPSPRLPSPRPETPPPLPKSQQPPPPQPKSQQPPPPQPQPQQPQPLQQQQPQSKQQPHPLQKKQPTPPQPKQQQPQPSQPEAEPNTKKQEPEARAPEPSEATDDQSLSVAGDDKDGQRYQIKQTQTLDFIKLNKLMAGKYKRRCAPEATKRGAVKPAKKEGKKEPAKAPATKPQSANAEVRSRVEEPSPVVVEAVTVAKPPPEAHAKPETPRPGVVRGVRAPSADSARRGGSLQRGVKSDIPVLQSRDAVASPRGAGRPNLRSASATPTPTKVAAPKSAIPVPPLTVQKPKQPKKRLIPTYTLTSYMSTPTDVLEYKQRELDKYLDSDLTVLDDSKGKKYKGKGRDALSKKNLDYLIMLQKRINHEISSNIENSMNYVKTLLSQDYNGTAIIEKAPVKNSLDMFDSSNGGIVLIEMNDQFDYSSSSSELSEESGFYCIYQGRNRRDRNRSLKREIIVKRNESGDSGLVDSRAFEELQNDTDSSYNCELSIVVNPKSQDEFFDEPRDGCRLYDGCSLYDSPGYGNLPNFPAYDVDDSPINMQDNLPGYDKHQPEDVSDVLKKYIYHLGGGEDGGDWCLRDPFAVDEPPKRKTSPTKKRRERVLDMPKEMTRQILEMLEEEGKSSPPPPAAATQAPTVAGCDGVDAARGGVPYEDEEAEEGVGRDQDAARELDNVEIISKISEMVMMYLDEYDKKLNSDDYTGGTGEDEEEEDGGGRKDDDDDDEDNLSNGANSECA